MLYVHENNFDAKIKNNYKNKKSELLDFKKIYYEPFKKSMLQINFEKSSESEFEQATKLFNEYYEKLSRFIEDNSITSQSKLESSLLEELNIYLFKDLPEIKNHDLDFYNKGIYAGLKINPDFSIDIIKKDVDFCIGRKATVKITGQNPISITVPIVSVEVKTYLDATMFGEIKSSSKSLKSATPNSKAYVLMGYKCLADEHIFSARQDAVLDEMFVLKESKEKPVDAMALKIYRDEIAEAIKKVKIKEAISVPGKLLRI